MDIFRVLDEIPLKTARLFCSRDLDVVINRLERANPSDEFRSRIVGRLWATVPPRDAFIDELLSLLADTVLATYPGWQADETPLHFDCPHFHCPRESENLSHKRTAKPAGSRYGGRGLLPEWLEDAVAYCEAGKSPVLPRFEREVQIRQLARVLRADRLILLAAFECKTLEESEGKVLADLIRWLVHLTDLRVGVLVDESVLEKTRALDGISYGAVRLDEDDRSRHKGKATGGTVLETPESAGPISGEGPISVGSPIATCEGPAIEPNGTEERMAARIAAPIIGLPHPFSPAERELARRLEEDEELRGLFRYNWPVETLRGERHIVDLLWQGGHLVVEVDGYSTHCGRRQFQRDRIRDRDLLLANYRVARVTHDEVMHDGAGVIRLIRALIHMRGSPSRGAMRIPT